MAGTSQGCFLNATLVKVRICQEMPRRVSHESPYHASAVRDYFQRLYTAHAAVFLQCSRLNANAAPDSALHGAAYNSETN